MVSNAEGLDMKPTIDWYKLNRVKLRGKIGQAVLDHITRPERDSYTILGNDDGNPTQTAVYNKTITDLLEMFPRAARQRSILRNIVCQPKTWFHKDSAEGQQKPTTSLEDALTETSIIPGFTDTQLWRDTGKPTVDVWLYQLPDSIPLEVRKIITAEALVHEFTHTLVFPALYVGDHTLRLSNGREVSGFDYVMEFAQMAEGKAPISRYASTFRTSDGKFVGGENANVQLTAISEEICETAAAYILGFAYCGDQKRSLDPFKDRPEIKDWIEEFLNAKLVEKRDDLDKSLEKLSLA